MLHQTLRLTSRLPQPIRAPKLPAKNPPIQYQHPQPPSHRQTRDAKVATPTPPKDWRRAQLAVLFRAKARAVQWEPCLEGDGGRFFRAWDGLVGRGGVAWWHGKCDVGGLEKEGGGVWWMRTWSAFEPGAVRMVDGDAVEGVEGEVRLWAKGRLV